jgi:hypothetical protein
MNGMGQVQMNKKNKSSTPFKAGMYLLDSFTSGMYNDPLIVYREYIQNAVDAIDIARGNGAAPLEVRIQLVPSTRTITIRDNALGLPSTLAEEVLSSIGSSNKADNRLRGFRGIGRLGGIAFSDRAVFRTKAKNESVESIQEWDCYTLRKLLAENKKELLTLEELFRRVTTFRQEQCRKTRQSYFEVSLSGVSSFRNQLFDLEKVRRYLQQVAPVPFDRGEFSYAPMIDRYLFKRLSNYGRYNIFLNGKPILKPYRDTVRITKGDCDHIDGVEFFEIENGKERPIAFGWFGQRRELLGSIARGDDSSGVRVRVGNIQIGDAHLLDFCYREPRFNSYVAGEVHVDCLELIPNSRRDDFVDNMKKGLFYNLIEKKVGLPISKEIRSRSRLASTKAISNPSIEGKAPTSLAIKEDVAVCECLNQSPQNQEGEARAVERAGRVERSGSAAVSVPETFQDRVLASLGRLCQGCPKLSEIFSIISQKDH